MLQYDDLFGQEGYMKGAIVKVLEERFLKWSCFVFAFFGGGSGCGASGI